MSIEVVRSQSLCLLERIAQLGKGARKAGERRRVVQRLEETRKRQANAYMALQRSKGLSRIGQAFIP